MSLQFPRRHLLQSFGNGFGLLALAGVLDDAQLLASEIGSGESPVGDERDR